MDNSGIGPLRVPGFGDIPVDTELRCEDRFAHGIDEWKQFPAITMREIAMVAVMNSLTDKPNWYVDISDQNIVDRWREEAFAANSLMSEDLGPGACVNCATRRMNTRRSTMSVSSIPAHAFANPIRWSPNNSNSTCKLGPGRCSRTKIRSETMWTPSCGLLTLVCIR